MNTLTETDLDRLRAKADQDVTDPNQAKAWALSVKEDLVDLIQLAEQHFRLQGGSLGVKVREAVEARILTELNGRAVLVDGADLHQVSVHLLEREVIVDVRLKIGRWKQ